MNFDIIENLKWLWNHLWAALKQMGGVAILTIIITFIVHKINTRFEKKIEHKYDAKIEELKAELDNQREHYKSLLEKRNYVSKTRFDTEFTVCKELMMACESMIEANHHLFPHIELVNAYGTGDMWSSHHQELWSNGADAVNTFSNKLEGYAPFISKEIYDEFRNILNVCKKNVYHYLCFNPNDRLYKNVTQEKKTEMLTKAFEDSLKLSNMLATIADKIRQYFQEMDIQEYKGA